MKRVLLLVPLVACASDDKPFTPATKPADPCSLLAQSDVQTVLPTAQPGKVVDTPPDTADYWALECDFDSPGAEIVELAIFGAKTQQGLTTLRYAAASHKVKQQVSGVGEEAYYWEEPTTDNGLWAIEGSYSVDITAYFFSPMPTADQLKPLVAKPLGEL